jgi:hypothetical protein
MLSASLCVLCQSLVVVGDPMHRLLGSLVAHLLSVGSGFFRAVARVLGVVHVELLQN